MYQAAFLIAFILFLFVGAMAINGFFNITRGHWQVLADGTKVKAGPLLKFWWFFWYKEWSQPIILIYKGDELLKLLNQWQNSMYKFAITKYEHDSILIASLPDEKTLRSGALSMGVNLCVFHDDSANAVRVSFRKEYPHYFFPEWVRDWLAGCITCHSSWLGSIIFWTAYALCNKNSLWIWIYGWTDYYYIALFVTWITYCFSLAFLSTFLWKKLNK